MKELVNNLNENESILFQDESSFYFSPEPRRIWAPKGSKPILRIHSGKKRLNVIGAIDPIQRRGYFQYIKNLDAVNFGQFLRGILAQYPENHKIYMILDNARSHHAKMLQKWLQINNYRLKLKFLPPYSPDLNPIEGIWKDAKSKATYNEFYEKFEEFQSSLSKTLHELSSDDEKLALRCNLEKYRINS